MEKIIIFAVAILIFVSSSFSAGQAFADDRLDKFKKSAEVEKTKPAKTRSLSESSSDQNSDYDNDDDESFWNVIFGEMFAAMFSAMGHAIAEAVFHDHGVRYRAFPYNKPEYAYHSSDRLPRAPGVLRTEYQRISSDLYGLGWRLTLRMPSGWDFSSSGIYYNERLNSGKHAKMSFGRFRLNCLLSPLEEEVLVRFGGGFAALEDRIGFDMGLEGDWFFKKPFALHAQVSHSFIGRGITDIDMGIGVFLGPWEIILGYRGLITKDDQLDGAFISFGLWF